MRYAKDIMLEKAIIHVIDGHADNAIVSTKELKINEYVETFVRKHVLKCLKANNTYAATFIEKTNRFAVNAQMLIDDNITFLESSKRHAQRLFNIIKNSEVSECDMLFVQFIANEQRCYGLMKLDHQITIGHAMSINNEEFVVHLNEHNSGLPGTGQAITKAVFFTKGIENIEMIVIDKIIKSEEAKQFYFLKEFLEAKVNHDHVSKTRIIKPLIERWVQKNLQDQIKKANQLRMHMNILMMHEKELFISKIFEIFEREEMALHESLVEHLKGYDFKIEDQFTIDKVFVDKNYKSKTVKTDTGLIITGDHTSFRDVNKVVIKSNGDGTVDYIIKNVRNITES